MENPDPVGGVSSPQARWVAALKSQNGATNRYNYHSDMGAALIYAGEQTYDAYGTNFPDEILTTSIGRLQNTTLNPTDTTGSGTNIVNTVTLYAANNYAQGDKINRVVVQKNNLNGGGVIDAPGGSSAWNDLYVLSQPPYNRPTAAQMVWHAYNDCDTYLAERMDAGDGSPCKDSTIMLYQAVDHGVTYGTKWQELYELDILNLGSSNGDTDPNIDPAKHDAIAYAHLQLYHPSPVVLTGMVSRLTHGGAGTYDIDLSAGNAVECRTPTTGGYKLVFTFSNNLTSVGGATLNGLPSGTVTLGPNANQCTVTFSSLGNAQNYTVALTNITDAVGDHSDSFATPRWGLLAGDVDGSRTVTQTDVSLTRGEIGHAVTTSNFREDVTVDGSINNSDVNVVKVGSGTVLPP